jgi:hypothetical protein
MRSFVFTFKCNQDERQAIAALAARLQRTESDAVRWVVKEAARELLAKSSESQQPAIQPTGAST